MLDCVRPPAALVMKRKTASATLPVLRTRKLLVLSAGRLTLEVSQNRSQVSEDRWRWIMLQKKSSWSTWSFPRSTGRSRLPVRTTQTLSVYSSRSWDRTWDLFTSSCSSSHDQTHFLFIDDKLITALLKIWFDEWFVLHNCWRPGTRASNLGQKSMDLSSIWFLIFTLFSNKATISLHAFFLPCFSLNYLPFATWITALPLPTPHWITVSLPAGQAFRFLRQFVPLLILQENGWVFSTYPLFDCYSCHEKNLRTWYSFLFRIRARKLPFLQPFVIASISTKGSPLRKGYRPRVHQTSYLLAFAW